MAGLYIHIPFCKRKCRYCDFISFSGVSDFTPYLDALMSEIRMLSPMMKERSFDSVFIGGGTPSYLPEGAIGRLLTEVQNCFCIVPDAEITIESNPDSITECKLSEYLNAGINRLSIGLQSTDDDVLSLIGRVHDLKQFLSAVDLARHAGFSNINADIMHGLPGQSIRSYLDTIALLAKLGIEHISSYALILEEGTPLYSDVSDGRIELPNADDVADMEDAGFELINELGYRRYEISNFAIPGFECRHNLNYWNNGEYLGLGLNAHSAMRLRGKWMRWANKDTLSDYIRDCAESKLPVAFSDDIALCEEMFETIMVGLRKIDGIDRSSFKNRFGIDPVEHYASAVSEAVLEGNMLVSDDTIRLTKRGLDFQNEVLLKFM